jgi:hypothetical protein
MIDVFPGETVFVNVADVKAVRLQKGRVTLILMDAQEYRVETPEGVERVVRVVGELAGLSEQEIHVQQREFVEKGGK